MNTQLFLRDLHNANYSHGSAGSILTYRHRPRVRKAIKAAWANDEIDGLMKNLETFKDAVEARIGSWAVSRQNVRI